MSHVTSTTSRGSRSSLAKARAKKAALLAQQKRQAERIALEQQKLQAEVQLEEAEVQLAHQKAQAEVHLAQQKAQAEVQLKQQRVRTRAQCKLLELQSENLQLQTDIEQQEAQERVYQEYEELTGLQFPTPETRRNTQVSEPQSQIHVDTQSVHDASAPTNVTMRQKNVVILDDVIDSGKHSAGVDRHVSSSASTGEASREQDLSDHYRGDAVTSAGAITPDSDTVGITRQIPAPPPTTTCSAQPRSVTPAPTI